MAAEAKDGKPHGHVPFGYRREYAIDGRGRRTIVGQPEHPEQAAVVRRIYDDVARASRCARSRSS